MTSYTQLSHKAQNATKLKASQSSHALNGYPTLLQDDLKLSEKGLTPEQRDLAWKKIHNYLHTHNRTLIGYQTNQKINFGGRLKDYLDLHINNAGDPFDTSRPCSVHTKAVECVVLDYFAKLWNIEVQDSMHADHHDEGYWGYIVSMGCTEANLCALYNARDYLAGKPLLRSDNDANSMANGWSATEQQNHDVRSNPNAFTPVAFYSEQAFHGFNKAMQILKIETFHDIGSGQFPCPLTCPDDYPTNYCEDFIDQNGWPHLVPADSYGKMHVPALVKLIKEFASRGYPPMVVFTSGTTFKGSFETPQATINELVPILKQHNLYERRVHYSSEDHSKFDIRHGFWFHVDGALGAPHLPYLEMAINQGLVDNQFPDGFPVFDFRIPEMSSIATSLHKWIGCPFPAGILIMRRKNQVKPLTNPLYIGGGDVTLCGSRNGHGALVAWDFLASHSSDDLAKRAARTEKLAEFTFQKLQEVEMVLGEDLWVSRSPGSLHVFFKQPKEVIVRKYQLASKLLRVKTKQGYSENRLYSHICLMPHVYEELIEKIAEELKKPEAFPSNDTNNIA